METSESANSTNSAKPVPNAEPTASSERANEAASVNGDKEMDVDETPASEGDKSAEDQASAAPVSGNAENVGAVDPPAVNRKRKLSDVASRELSDDSSPTEFLGFTPEDIAKPNTEKKSKLDKIIVKPEDISLALRKGKRSRIPNKRYEDLSTITSYGKPPFRDLSDVDSIPEITSSEDGRNEDGTDTQKTNDSFEVASSANSSPSKKNSRSSMSGSSSMKKPKVTIDMSNPLYLKPFSLGWRRELVYRQTYDTNLRRNGDVYYYTPSGRKVRSMREIIESLDSKELTVKNFTFFKEPVGINDLTKEIVREAKQISPWAQAVNRKGIGKSKGNFDVSNSASAADTPKGSKSPRLGGFKVKFPGSSRLSHGSHKNDRKRAGQSDADMEIGMLPPWSPKKGSSGAKPTSWQAKSAAKPCRPCSIRCRGAFGLIPTLQCRLCLCLYHKECVGELFTDLSEGYVCKNCHLDIQDTIEPSYDSTPSIGPPPLTPISALKSNSTQSTTPPKLQRIPKPSMLSPQPSIVLQPSKPKICEPLRKQMREPLNKTIVGSVTTWFPPNSTIKLSNTHEPTDGVSPKPQGLVFMGERKFLVVPKSNVLSISPILGAVTPNTPSNVHLVTPAGDQAPAFDAKDKNVGASLGPSGGQMVAAQESPPANKAELKSRKLVADFLKPSGETLKENQRDTSPPKTRRSTNKKVAGPERPAVKPDSENMFMQNYLQNLSYGYQTLLHVFQYLKVQDLLRAGCVCTLWRDIAAHPTLWKVVRMKNSQVSDWEGLADCLKKHGTDTLDLRKMLLPSSGDSMWPSFTKAISRVDSLVRIEFCRCPASVIEDLIKNNRNLKVLNAMTVKCQALDISAISALTNLQELRLKSTSGFVLTSDLTPLKSMIQLKHLSLISVREFNKLNVNVIGNLVNLESLDLGECSDFPDSFGADVILKLTKLEKLRLEKGQESCSTFNILDAVSKIPSLEQLELVNFDVKAGFDKALGACTNIKKLLIIPTYISQSATTNHMVLGGVIKLKSTLSHFVWGVTLELLRVTELFVDQCEDSPNKDKKKPTGNCDSIPVLKPVPIMKSDELTNDLNSKDPPQVEILPLPTLQKLLLSCLPTTRVKILKIPFHATWRQSIVDTVN